VNNTGENKHRQGGAEKSLSLLFQYRKGVQE